MIRTFIFTLFVILSVLTSFKLAEARQHCYDDNYAAELPKYTEILYRFKNENEVRDGQVWAYSPNKIYICLNDHWYTRSNIIILEVFSK